MPPLSKKTKTTQTKDIWSELHEDLIIKIARKFLHIEDFIRFRAVCRPWRSATCRKQDFSLFSNSQFPWLMLTEDEDSDYRAFFSPLENKVRNINLPELRGCQCWGSPFGWLVTHRVHQGQVELHLLNPLSRTRIPLSSRANIAFEISPLEIIHRATIVTIFESCEGKQVNFIVFAIVGIHRNLVFTINGVNTWMNIPNDCTFSKEDFMSFNGFYYTVDNRGYVRPFIVHLLIPLANSFVEPLKHTGKLYLVEIDREIHIVDRNIRSTSSRRIVPYKTVSIQVYKFDHSNKKWEELETLGDNIVFVGRNASFSLKASQYPGCKPNCIYFTEDERVRDKGKVVPNDRGIFNMRTRKIECLHEGKGMFTQSSWILPIPF